MGDGAITAAHVDAVTRTSRGLDPGQREELLERADQLVAVATAATVEEFRRRLALEAKRLQQDDWTIELGPHRQLTLRLPDGTIHNTGRPDRRTAA